MVVVLFVLGIIILILVWLITVFYSTLKINIKTLKISTNSKLHDYKVNFGIYFLGKIKIFGLTITKTKLENSKLIKKINMKNFEEIVPINKELLKNIKSLKISIDKLNLNIKVGIEEAQLTPIAVLAISTLLSNTLPRVVKPKNVKI